MSEFGMYFQLGINHILDPQALDHLIFIITLCAAYSWKSWKHVLILVTAFTIGHSLTLALAAFDLIQVPSTLIEILIPVTILITSIYNLTLKEETSRRFSGSYALALGFGLIHGMGFSNYFRTLMGSAEHVIRPLFAFNVGIEIGQLAIVVALFVCYYLLQRIFTFSHRDWRNYLSGIGGGAAILLLADLLF